MSEQMRTAAKKIAQVAQRLASRNDPRSAELYKFAQFMDQMPDSASASMMSSFDPSQNSMPVSQMSSQNHGNPMIESYVKKDAPMQSADNRITHILTVTIMAPPDLSEAKMMNYILQISEIGAEPTNFSWTRKEPKESKSQ